jgi:hypothetical protein
MNKKTKPEEKKAEEIEKKEEKSVPPEIIKDQTERGYYYDDACGYEVYVDENEEQSSS